MDETKALTGLSIEPPEVDIDDIEDPVVEASNTYDELTLINSMGTKEFEMLFPYVANVVKSLDIFEKMSFFKSLIDKFNTLYETDFNITGNESFDELREIIDMIMFFEFDNIEFLSRIWKEFTINLMKVKPTILDFCILNQKNIINQIDILCNQIKNKHIKDFLLNYNGNLLIQWFAKKSEEKKIEITLSIIGGGNENG